MKSNAPCQGVLFASRGQGCFLCRLTGKSSHLLRSGQSDAASTPPYCRVFRQNRLCLFRSSNRVGWNGETTSRRDKSRRSRLVRSSTSTRVYSNLLKRAISEARESDPVLARRHRLALRQIEGKTLTLTDQRPTRLFSSERKRLLPRLAVTAAADAIALLSPANDHWAIETVNAEKLPTQWRSRSCQPQLL